MESVRLGPETPIKSFEEDVFDYSNHAMDMAQILLNAEPATMIGLYSPWGSGKSSYLQLTKLALEGKAPEGRESLDSEGILPIYFGAWDHENPQGLLPTLMMSIGQRLESGNGKLKKSFMNVAGALAVLTANWGVNVATAGAVDIGKIADAFKMTEEMAKGKREKFISSLRVDPHNIFKNNLKDALGLTAKNGTKKIVILIDDLDRCHPENIFTFLDNLRRLVAIIEDILNSGKPPECSIVGLIAADEEIINLSIKTKYPDMRNEPSDYLYKLLSVSKRLPAPSGDGYRKFLDKKIVQLQLNERLPNISEFTRKLTELILLEHEKPITPRHIATLLRSIQIVEIQTMLKDSEFSSDDLLGSLPFSLIAVADPARFKIMLQFPQDKLDEIIERIINYKKGRGASEQQYATYTNRSVKEDWDTFQHSSLLLRVYKTSNISTLLSTAAKITGFV